MEELTLIYSQERHRFESQTGGEDMVILDCYEPPSGQLGLFEVPPTVAVKTQAGPDDFSPQLSYRFYGRWTSYTNKRTSETQKQFLAKTFVRCQPHGQAGTIRYLMRAPNVGRQTAKTLWDKFQGDAVRILRESPDVAAAAVGSSHFKINKAKEASDYLRFEQALEDCTIDLIDLLGGQGFPRSTPRKAVERWGNLAADVIRKSPYHLMKFRGCGFLRCDQLYLSLGHDPKRLKRQAWCAWYSLARNTEGHTWFDTKTIETGLRGMIGGTDTRPIDAVKLAKRAGLLATHRDVNGELWLADGRKARAEERVAELVSSMLKD